MPNKVDNKTTGYHELYVTCQDKFLSGWGEAAGGKSFYAIGVDSQEEAETVLRNAKDRSDMKSCEIRSTWLGLERKRGNNHIKVVDRAEASRWFDPSRPFKQTKR